MKIFETRNLMLESLPKGLKIAELGVFEGEFSKEIYSICKPKELNLVDLFSGIFGSGDKDGKNHRYINLDDALINIQKYFIDKLDVFIYKNSTVDFLMGTKDNYFDMIYIDADHSYNSVKKDLELSYQKIKPNGFICGHDYVTGTEAFHAVNDFCDEYKLSISCLTNDGCPSFLIVK
jgi:hypothetical protein